MLSSKLANATRRLSCKLITAVDWAFPKSPRLWVFPYTRPEYWGSNQRALYDYIQRERPDLQAVTIDLCERGKYVPVSWRALRYLVRARTVIVHHGVTDYRKLLARRPLFGRVVYNVWHGVNIKAIGTQLTRQELEQLAQIYAGVTASSDANRRTLSEGLAVPMQRVFATGLPRNDWLLCPESELPEHFTEQLRHLRKLLNGRRLVLYAPTFRPNPSGRPSAGFYPFNAAELTRLSELFARHNLVFGCRAHVNALHDELPSGSLPLGPSEIMETQVLLREAAALVTDYSGIWVDYLLTRRPMIAFCHDRERYPEESNLVYDLEAVFPGARVTRFDEFTEAVKEALEQSEPHPNYGHALALFHAYEDTGSCRRVTEMVESLQRQPSLVAPPVVASRA